MTLSKLHPPRALRRARLALASLTLASAALLAPARAVAQGAASDPTLAQALFEEGRRLMETKDYAQACPKLAESQRLRPGTGTLLNLALCNEALGKTATAWGQFKEALFFSKKEGNAAREAFAQEHISALEPRLSKIRINAENTPGLAIRNDGQEIPAAALGTPIPVDPGSHQIEATAQGYSVWSTTVQVGENADLKTIAVPKLVPMPVEAAKPAGPQPSGGGSAGGGGLRTAGFVVGGVGVAALGAGAVLGILAAGQASDAEDDPALCPNKQCTPRGREEIDAAETKALLSTIGVGVGVAAIGAGVVLVLTSGPSRAESASAAGARRSAPGGVRAQVVPVIGPGGGGVGVLGTF
ncbi:tetratricopeptide repeat protein [Sorangium sp. So ce131]|uniref:tetratricopeptide repeat protein n=1 Tax=Sorangium sp. So ce131 TaxID=3133282 RepID=UPI003F610A43